MDLSKCADISEMWFRVMHPEEFESVTNQKGVVGMRFFPDGAWVTLKLKDFPHSVGYVNGYSYLTGNYFVKVTIIKGMQVNPDSNNTMQLPHDCLSLADDLDITGFDNSFLIDLALATKDQEWFDQLMNGGK